MWLQPRTLSSIRVPGTILSSERDRTERHPTRVRNQLRLLERDCSGGRVRYTAPTRGFVARALVELQYAGCMVFVRDEGSVFKAPLEDVWRFLDSGASHSEAHGHAKVRRILHAGQAGTYSWEQRFEGRVSRFAMRWTSYWPLGLAYRVTKGPFRGSNFFLYYEPRGRFTGVTIVGDFASRTIPQSEIGPAVRRFFGREFEQDSAALKRWIRSKSRRR